MLKRFRPKTTGKAQVFLGRIAAVIIMIAAMLWSTQGGNFSVIFEAINKIAAAMAPPITNGFFIGGF
jgi:SSS family solute:Na+ symporter